jgi:hypothetical protein
MAALETNSAGDLLEAGSVVILQHRVRAALLGVDGRCRGPRPSRSTPISRSRSAEPAGRTVDRRPRFIDYLYSVNATAFSPTDVMPVPWAKITMAVQAVVSIGILGLVIARAVNVFK